MSIVVRHDAPVLGAALGSGLGAFAQNYADIKRRNDELKAKYKMEQDRMLNESLSQAMNNFSSQITRGFERKFRSEEADKQRTWNSDMQEKEWDRQDERDKRRSEDAVALYRERAKIDLETRQQEELNAQGQWDYTPQDKKAMEDINNNISQINQSQAILPEQKPALIAELEKRKSQFKPFKKINPEQGTKQILERFTTTDKNGHTIWIDPKSMKRTNIDLEISGQFIDNISKVYAAKLKANTGTDGLPIQSDEALWEEAKRRVETTDPAMIKYRAAQSQKDDQINQINSGMQEQEAKQELVGQLINNPSARAMMQGRGQPTATPPQEAPQPEPAGEPGSQGNLPKMVQSYKNLIDLRKKYTEKLSSIGDRNNVIVTESRKAIPGITKGAGGEVVHDAKRDTQNVITELDKQIKSLEGSIMTEKVKTFFSKSQQAEINKVSDELAGKVKSAKTPQEFQQAQQNLRQFIMMINQKMGI